MKKQKLWYEIVLRLDGKEDVICKVKSKGLAEIILKHLKTIYKEPFEIIIK